MALGRFPTLLSSWWHFVPNLKRLCLPASSSRFQIEQFQELFGERVSEWKVNTDVSYVTLLLSLRASQLIALPSFSCPGCLVKEGKSHMGSRCSSPCWKRIPSPGEATASVGCTLFAGSRMFFLWWARDFSSSNSDVEHQPLGPRNVRHGLSETRAAASSVMAAIFALSGKYTDFLL